MINPIDLRVGMTPTVLDAAAFMASRSASATVGADTIYYNGYAAPGSVTSAAVWCISRITLAADGTTATEFPGGAATFSQVWDNHAALTYS